MNVNFGNKWNLSNEFLSANKEVTRITIFRTKMTTIFKWNENAQFSSVIWNWTKSRNYFHTAPHSSRIPFCWMFKKNYKLLSLNSSRLNVNFVLYLFSFLSVSVRGEKKDMELYDMAGRAWHGIAKRQQKHHLF